MNLFEPNAKCPKCGHDVVRTYYCRGSKYSYFASPCYDQRAEGEHLHRHCERCAYAWLEQCIPPATVDEIAARATARHKDTGGGGNAQTD